MRRIPPLLLVLFVLSILGLIVFETLLPLYRAGDVPDAFRVWATLPPAGLQTRGANVVALLRVWRLGTVILLGGFALIAVGGFVSLRPNFHRV